MNITTNLLPHSEEAAYRRRWRAMFTLLTATFLTGLDVSIVNLGLPDVEHDLIATDRGLQWVVVIYVLTFGLGLLPLARLGDIIGRRIMVLSGMVAFLLTSALCAAAPTIAMLILMRGLQGFSAAMMSSQVLPIAQTMFAGPERAKVAPLFGLAGGLSGIAGPIIAGILLHLNYWDLGWRLLYLINIPICLVALFAAVAWVPICPPQHGLKNDPVGITLSSAAILCMIFPLVQGRLGGWPISTFPVLVLSMVLIALFLHWERRQDRLGRSALLPVYLLANRDYLRGSAAILLFFCTMQGFFVVFALYLQQGLGLSPLNAGLTNVPFPIGIILATAYGNRLATARVRLYVGIGMLVTVFLAMQAITHGAERGTLGTMHFVVPMFIFGVATGLSISALFQTVMRTVPLRDAGAGMGAVQVVQQVGGAIGLALASAIFFNGTFGQHVTGAFNAAFGHVLVYQIVVCAMVAVVALTMVFDLPAHLRPPLKPNL